MKRQSENGSLLQGLREQRGLSQRRLAEICGISRGRLQRLEAGGLGTATYEEMVRIAQALGIAVEEMFRINGHATNGVHLGKRGQDIFQYEGRRGGYRIISLITPREDLFVGKLFLSAKNRVFPDETPRARTIFLQALMGALRVEVNGKSYQIQEGDHLIFAGDTPYKLENPFIREQVSLLITYPAFALSSHG